MKVSKKEVQDAILNNNTARVTEMLERFNLTKDGTPPHFTSADKELVSTMLSFASAMSYRDDLDSGLAEELIERTAMTVNIFPFVRLVVAVAEIETDDFDVIPEEIRTALRKNDYTDQIARAIEDLDDDTFEAFLAYYITGEIEKSHVKFSLPVIRHIYNDEVIPADLLFAFMASNLRKTIDEHFGGLHGTLGALGGLTLLDALISGMHDDEESKEKEE